jgi:hypothetical protein
MMHQMGASFINSFQPSYRPISYPYNQAVIPQESSTRESFSSESIIKESVNTAWKMSILKELQEIKSILLAMMMRRN